MQIRKPKRKKKRERAGRGYLNNVFKQHLFIYKVHAIIISAGSLEGLQRLVIFSPYPQGPIGRITPKRASSHLVFLSIIFRSGLLVTQLTIGLKTFGIRASVANLSSAQLNGAE